MATDMPDWQFACTEACRNVSVDGAVVEKKNKRIGRLPEKMWSGSSIGRFVVEGGRVLTDSDWAGDLDTRKSTGGSIIVLGEHYLRVLGSRTRAHPH